MVAREKPTEEDMKLAVNELTAGIHARWDAKAGLTILSNAFGAMVGMLDLPNEAAYNRRFDDYAGAAREVMHDIRVRNR